MCLSRSCLEALFCHARPSIKTLELKFEIANIYVTLARERNMVSNYHCTPAGSKEKQTQSDERATQQFHVYEGILDRVGRKYKWRRSSPAQVELTGTGYIYKKKGKNGRNGPTEWKRVPPWGRPMIRTSRWSQVGSDLDM